LNDLTLSLIQIRPNGRDSADRLRELAGSLPEGTDVLLLPEAWQSNDPTESERCLETLSQICAERHVFAISGGMPWDNGGGRFLRTWVLGDSGEVIACCDKTHLSSKHGEDKIYSPGRGPVIFNIGEAACAALSGFDMMFPEYCRQISLAGAQIFLVSANLSGEFAHVWEPLMKSAAFTNQCFVAACATHGNSAVISPFGEVVGMMGRGEGVMSFQIKLSDVPRCRKAIPLERDRRGEIYAVFP
jgi:predicted amidohydrolase